MALTAIFGRRFKRAYGATLHSARAFCVMPLKAFLLGRFRSARNYCAIILMPRLAFRSWPRIQSCTSRHCTRCSGPKGNPTASNLFEIVAYLQRQEGVRLHVRTSRAVA